MWEQKIQIVDELKDNIKLEDEQENNIDGELMEAKHMLKDIGQTLLFAINKTRKHQPIYEVIFEFFKDRQTGKFCLLDIPVSKFKAKERVGHKCISPF